MIEDLMKPAEVARHMGISLSLLYTLNRRNEGPAYIQISPKKRRYRRGDVESFLASKERAK